MDTSQINWSNEIRYSESNSVIIPTSAGIYKILRNSGEAGKRTRVYVGKADNLNTRYNDHLSEYEQNLCIKRNLKNYECYFRYALVSREEDRQNYEAQLLREGTYECNVQGQ